MSEPRSLDRWGELYIGFNRDRVRLRRELGARADGVWEKAFARIRKTTDENQASDEEVASTTMRSLMVALDVAERPK